MVNSFLKIVFVVEFLEIINIVFCQSPCPKYFRYYRDEFSQEIMAVVEIPSPPKGVPLMLRVTLSVPAALSEKYLGRLELFKSKKESVQAVSQGKSLFYRIQFPLQEPLPILTGIALNNLQYCIGPRATGPVVSFIYLEHTLYPPGIIPMLNFQNANQCKLPVVNPTILVPNPKTDFGPYFSDSDDINNWELNGNCGITKNVDPLVARETKSYPGDWPWLVAIFFAKIDFEYQCVGNLVTQKHVITVAHCLKLYGENVPANVILVSLGRHFLEDWGNPGTVNREVSEIRFHPDFDNSSSADADLAVLVLRKPVNFSSEIQPICLWKGPRELDKIVGERGYVVGWGRNDPGQISAGEPRLTTPSVVSQETCLRSHASFIEMTSNRTFCAGTKTGTSPCNGNSGSGFVIFDPKTGRYRLRGIASLSIVDKKTISCELNQYIVYVDLAKHHEWIVKQISSDPS